MDREQIFKRVDSFVNTQQTADSPRVEDQALLRLRSFLESRPAKLMLLFLLGLGVAYSVGLNLKSASGNAMQQPSASSDNMLTSVPASTSVVHQDFAGKVNFEMEEVAVLEKATRSVDVAMYSFTDAAIASELVRLSRRGVQIRVFRDAEQYREEEARAEASGMHSANSLLRASDVQVRLCTSGQPMMIRAYTVDDSFERTGSADWSASSLFSQYADVTYIQATQPVQTFRDAFEAFWQSRDSVAIQ